MATIPDGGVTEQAVDAWVTMPGGEKVRFVASAETMTGTHRAIPYMQAIGKRIPEGDFACLYCGEPLHGEAEVREHWVTLKGHHGLFLGPCGTMHKQDAAGLAPCDWAEAMSLPERNQEPA